MKFGDKLCKLRKKEGLSQEELGEKLNVTRQTVSKWELGQSKPDTDKLVELCSLLGVSVNDLMDDNVSITNNSHRIDSFEMKPRRWLLVVLIVVALAITVILLNKIMTDAKTNDNKEKGNNSLISNIVNNTTSEFNKEVFNNKFDFYVGTKNSTSLKYLLDEVIKNNKKDSERTIEVTYKEVSTKDPEEIKNLKSQFNTTSDYEISIDYDDNGYANKVIIEDVFKDVSVNSFNIFLDGYHGKQYGIHIKSLLDNVISSNKKYPIHQVNVIYQKANTTDGDEIRAIRDKLGDMKKYEVTVDYDDAGYVKQIKIG